MLYNRATEPSTNPAVQVHEHRGGLGYSKVGQPAPKTSAQFLDHALQGDASRAAGDLFDPGLNVLHSLRGEPDFLKFPSREANAEESPFLGSGYGALFPVDAQSQAFGQEPFHRVRNSMPRPFRLHIDIAVVGIAAELMSSTLQFFVQLIQEDVAEQGRQRAALRRPFVSLLDHSFSMTPA